MSQYCLNINGDIGLGDYSSINDYMSLVGNDDRLTITLDKKNDMDVELICSLLQKKNFQIVSCEVSNDGKYHITTYKIK
jgi:hypothetical protein